MEFTQVAPTRAEADDGTIVTLVDRFHARLESSLGEWLVELGPADDEDWIAINVFRESLLRSGGEPQPAHNAEAMKQLVAGLRALAVRVRVREPDAHEGA